MIIWLATAIMTVGALILILFPFIRKNLHAPPRVNFDLEIYRDQLRELENEKERGLIDDEQSKAAKLEIERRMLTVVKRSGAQLSNHAQEKNKIRHPKSIFNVRAYQSFLTLAVLAVIPALVIPVYLYLGSPEKPGKPFLDSAEFGEIEAKHDSAGQSMETAINNLRERLTKTPENLEGWYLLGRSLVSLERYDEASRALRTAAILSNGDPNIVAAMGEALVFSNNGIVTAEAVNAFQAVLSTQPNDPAAQYYLGMAAAQNGKPDVALRIWQQLASQTPQNAPWREDLSILMGRAAEETGVKLSEIKVENENSQPGPTQDDIAAASAMSSEERMAMIQSMVENLAAKLEDDPNNLKGWERLANAYRVLGQNDKAQLAEKRIAKLENELNQASIRNSSPSEEEIAEASQMSPEDRNQMILAMVENLAGKLRNNPTDLNGWIRLGRSYSVLKQHENAQYAYSQATKLAPENIVILNDYARTIVNAAGKNSGLPKEAFSIYKRIIELDPSQKEALWFLGFYEASTKNKDRARYYWDRLLKILPPDGPDHKVVKDALDGL